MVLKKRYKIKEAHIADILEVDRATACHSIKRAEDLLSVKDPYYVMAIQRWKSIIDEFEEEMLRVSSVMKHHTTVSVILDVLKKYPEDVAINILEEAKAEVKTWTIQSMI